MGVAWAWLDLELIGSQLHLSLTMACNDLHGMGVAWAWLGLRLIGSHLQLSLTMVCDDLHGMGVAGVWLGLGLIGSHLQFSLQLSNPLVFEQQVGLQLLDVLLLPQVRLAQLQMERDKIFIHHYITNYCLKILELFLPIRTWTWKPKCWT